MATRPAEPAPLDSRGELPTNRGLGHRIRQPNSLIRHKLNGGILRKQINCLATNQVSPTVLPTKFNDAAAMAVLVGVRCRDRKYSVRGRDFVAKPKN